MPWSSHLKGVLVALHLVAITVMALPTVGDGLRRKAWQEPTVQEELDAWHARVQAWGVDVTRAQFEDGLWDLASGWARTHDAVKAPFWPYLRYCGAWQGWRMFVAPHKHPSRLHIDIAVDGEWQPVYRARSDDHAWLRTKLDHHRMRSAMFRFAWPTYRKPFTQFSEWTARQAAIDFPHADAVRLRFARQRTLPAEALLAGEEAPVEMHTKRQFDLTRLRD